MRLLRDVIVQRSDEGDQLAVISQEPGLADESLTLDVIRNGDTVRLKVSMMESQPVVHEGAVRHRLHLEVLADGDPWDSRTIAGGNGPHLSGSDGDLFGVLGREVSVRLLNISGSGCLLESRDRLEQGATGGVRLRRRGEEYRDDIRVTRCQVVHGAGSLYLLGAEFLWTSQPGKRSLRRVIRRLQGRPAQRSK